MAPPAPDRTATRDTPADPAAERMTPRQRGLALGSVIAATCATVLESMAVGVALPRIAADLDVSAAAATWVLGVSQLVIVALLLPMASLGESIGYRRVYLVSLVVMVVTTLGCVAAPSLEVLIAARAAQAVGTAGAMSVGFALAREIFPDKRLGIAVGALATTVALASSFGPAVSGAILTFASWRWVFALILPFAVAGLILGYFRLPRRPGTERPFDGAGAASIAVMMAGLLLSINAVAHGWPPAGLVAALVLSLAAATVVSRRGRHLPAPIFPFDLLAIPVFALSIAASTLTFCAQFLAFVALPFHLLLRFGLTELEMSLVLTAWSLAVAIVAPVFGRLSDGLPAGLLGFAGLAVLSLGLSLLALMPEGTGIVGILWRAVVCGIGFGAFQTPNNRLIMVTAPKERSGAASGMIGTARQFGRAVGTAIAALALATAGTGDTRLALLIAAGCAALGAAASLGREFARDRPA